MESFLNFVGDFSLVIEEKISKKLVFLIAGQRSVPSINIGSGKGVTDRHLRVTVFDIVSLHQTGDLFRIESNDL